MTRRNASTVVTIDYEASPGLCVPRRVVPDTVTQRGDGSWVLIAYDIDRGLNVVLAMTRVRRWVEERSGR